MVLEDMIDKILEITATNSYDKKLRKAHAVHYNPKKDIILKHDLRELLKDFLKQERLKLG